ncbi:hypothetical protein VTP01DRAFT_6450 [Rhizomucor pusillus]|uniref:uncharacterized protein n=1 Tax=Rhizomucor pusillus TaxID=4840 RepID=UPI0037432577
MGGTQSTEQGRHGFHVLRVKENSPAHQAGIDQFFDYIVGIDGVSVDDGDTQACLEKLQQSEDKPLKLQIYSSKDQEMRDVTIVPSKKWHAGNPSETSLIGCSIRYCSYERAGELVWHVLDVAPNSPAEMAGIIPHTDYIIGSPNMVLTSEEDFYHFIDEYLGKPLRLYLYNSDWDSCREAIIVPNHDWGGNGSLGCDVGYGLLHRIPRRSGRKSTSSQKESAPQDQTHTESPSVYSNTIFSSADFESGRSSNEDQNASEEAPRESTEHYVPGSSNSAQAALLEEAQNTALPASPTVE